MLVAPAGWAMRDAVDIEPADGPHAGDVNVEGLRPDAPIERDGEAKIDAERVLDGQGKAEGLPLGQRSATRAIAERLLAKGTARAEVEEAIGTPLADLGL